MPAKVTRIRPRRTTSQPGLPVQRGSYRALHHSEPLTDADRKVLRLLESVPIRIWPRKRLVEAAGMTDRAVRRCIEKLQRARHPVLSTSDSSGGYWLASTAAEVEEFRERELHSRLRVIADKSRVLGEVAKLMRDRERVADRPALMTALL